MHVRARWIDGFKFDAWDSHGREMKLDASVEAGGEGLGFRPVELPLIGLAGCTGMDTVEILKKMREHITGLSVTVSADKRPEVPPGYSDIHVVYEVAGKGLSRDKVERAVRLSEEKYCTVGAALSKSTTITHTIRIVEE